MNRKEERELKKLIRAKRVELLDRQKELDIQHCQQCTRNRRTNNDCIGCEVFNELRSIGRELMNLSNGNFEIVRKETKQVTKAIEESEKLTVEVYKELKEQGMSDTKISEQFNIPASTFYQWKKKNGLIKSKAEKVTEIAESEKITDAPIEELRKQFEALRKEYDALLKEKEKIHEEKKLISEKVKSLIEENEQLSINTLRANQLYEEAQEEIKTLKKQINRGEFYMRLSLMLMEGILAEVKEDAS